MIHAAQIIAFAAAQRKRRQPVDAAILKRGIAAASEAVDDDRLPQDRDGIWLA
jgi:hypothetical protein